METAIKNNQRRIRISRLKIEDSLKQAAKRLSNNYPRRFGMLETCEVSVLLINDRTMRELNLQYRGIDKPTDVLSFPQIAFSVKREALSARHYNAINARRTTQLGDIVINLHQAERQAKEYGVTFHQEVERLLIHGLLHLLGYDHEKSVYEARKMRSLEEELLGAKK